LLLFSHCATSSQTPIPLRLLPPPLNGGSRFQTRSRLLPLRLRHRLHRSFRKWKKKWVLVTPSSSPTNTNTNTTTSNNYHAPANSKASSLLLLRRWTPTTDEEPPRRKFRYTPIVVLEEQKKIMVKEENEPATESDQSAARQTNVTHEMHGKLNMYEMLEGTKDSDIVKLDHGLVDLQSHNDETSQNSDTELENNI
ncbi:hypothetical protein PHAVU_009G196400, partial [Phaseolus vulgaris]